MFWIQKHKEIENWQNDFDKIMCDYIKKVEELEKNQDAIIECLKGDRKDINILIQMIKKSQTITKRKK